MKTNGWDTVYVTDIANVNKSLAATAESLVQTLIVDEDGVEIDGKFGAWEIVPGGSGELLYLQITFAEGSMTVAKGAAPADLKGVRIVLTVSLQLLPKPGAANDHELRFHFASVAKEGEANPGNGVVSFNKAVLPAGSKLTPLQQTVVGMGVAQALVAHASEVSFVLATINPLAVAVSWLRPQSLSYCYADVKGSGAQMLAILAVNTSRSTKGLKLSVDPALFAKGESAGLAISGSLFLANVLAPALAAKFKTAASNFRLGAAPAPETGPGLVLAKAFNLPAAHAAGETYRPSVDSLSAYIKDTQLFLALSGKCDMHMNITMTFQSSSVIGVTFVPATRTFKFATVGGLVFHHHQSIPWYDHLVDVAGGIAEIILQACVAAIGSELGNSVAKMGGASDISTYAPDVVSWSGRGGFTPDQGGLATSLYLRGKTK